MEYTERYTKVASRKVTVDTRERILEEALRLFATYGYDGTGVQAIVEAAEVTKPTLYHYFKNKQGLFETLVMERSAGLTQAVQESSRYAHDIRLSIRRVVETYFAFAVAHPVFYRLLISAWFAPPSSEYFAVVQMVMTMQYQMMEQMFLQAAADHGNMRGRHQQYAVSLKGMIDTYIGMALQGHLTLNDDQLVYRITHQFMHGIFS